MVARNDKVRIAINDYHHQTAYSVQVGLIEVPRPVNAPQGATHYHVWPTSDKNYEADFTGFVLEQEFLAENNMPFLMSMLSEPEGTFLYPGMGQQTSELDLWGRRMRLFPGILPDRISHKVEAWRLAVWIRLGKPFGLDNRDIAARFSCELFKDGGPCAKYLEKGGRLFANIGMKWKRYLWKAGAPNLDHEVYAEPADERIDQLTDEQVESDTVWSLTLDSEGKRATGQVCNEWGAIFTIPEHAQKDNALTAIAHARERIPLKKDLFHQQQNEQRVAGKRFVIKSWVDVVLPDKVAPKRRKADDSATANNANAERPSEKLVATAHKAVSPLTDLGPITVDPSSLQNPRPLRLLLQPLVGVEDHVMPMLTDEQLAMFDDFLLESEGGYNGHNSESVDEEVSVEEMKEWFHHMQDKYLDGTINKEDFEAGYLR